MSLVSHCYIMSITFKLSCHTLLYYNVSHYYTIVHMLHFRAFDFDTIVIASPNYTIVLAIIRVLRQSLSYNRNYCSINSSNIVPVAIILSCQLLLDYITLFFR